MFIGNEKTIRKGAFLRTMVVCLLLALALPVWVVLSRSIEASVEKKELEREVKTDRKAAAAWEDAERHGHFRQQALALLQLYKEICHLGGRNDVVTDVDGAITAGHVNLCSALADAAGRLKGERQLSLGAGVLPQALFHFSLMQAERERAIGPFFSQVECSEVAARLAQFGEQVTPCLPYEHWHYELLLTDKER
ncbi:hypothetical protein [Halomonas sp. KM-1]|uniref:hypothetical protein n=1 Tax=Halomonas sp. KM-1 TaxID=590061 RepID=UPI000287C957|nr:hypothetical protein [Halomonas sp. KM-1]